MCALVEGVGVWDADFIGFEIHVYYTTAHGHAELRKCIFADRTSNIRYRLRAHNKMKLNRLLHTLSRLN